MWCARAHRLGHTQNQESSAQQSAGDEAALADSARHDAAAGWLCAERERRQHVGADVERQHLHYADCERQLSAGQRPGGEGREFGDIVS